MTVSKPIVPPEPDHLPLMLSVAAACQQLSISRATLYRWSNARRIVMKKVGGKTLVVTASLLKLIEDTPDRYGSLDRQERAPSL